MKTIGLIGGMSWESTVTYYRVINETVKRELGDLHSAKCILYSVDFFEIEECQKKGEWTESGEILGKAAESLEKAGADFIVICTNTMHKVIDTVKKYTAIPIIHIADLTADEIISKKIREVILLGTKYTMEQDFYKSKLIEKGIEVIIPNKDDIEIINEIIYNELCLGIIKEESKQQYLQIIKKLSENRNTGVILGCTEIGLLVKQDEIEAPLFDTGLIHAEKAALYSIDKL